jgi:hypothetical protein
MVSGTDAAVIAAATGARSALPSQATAAASAILAQNKSGRC